MMVNIGSYVERVRTINIPLLTTLLCGYLQILKL